MKITAEIRANQEKKIGHLEIQHQINVKLCIQDCSLTVVEYQKKKQKKKPTRSLQQLNATSSSLGAEVVSGCFLRLKLVTEVKLTTGPYILCMHTLLFQYACSLDQVN